MKRHSFLFFIMISMYSVIFSGFSACDVCDEESDATIFFHAEIYDEENTLRRIFGPVQVCANPCNLEEKCLEHCYDGSISDGRLHLPVTVNPYILDAFTHNDVPEDQDDIDPLHSFAYASVYLKVGANKAQCLVNDVPANECSEIGTQLVSIYLKCTTDSDFRIALAEAQKERLEKLQR